MHEILTLQLGQQANYLATHFWNIQESYFTYAGEAASPVNHDVHFRQGIGADGSDTYLPRTLIYDFKDAFGTLRRTNALYEMQQELDLHETSLWGRSTITQRAPVVPPNEYQQHLDLGLEPPPLTPDTVRYWSDYNRVFYHPRSIIQLTNHELEVGVKPFEKWEVGQELFESLMQKQHLLESHVRPFLEECDHLQGMQIYSQVDDAWGGFTAKYVEALRDELGKTSIWVWGLEDNARKARVGVSYSAAFFTQVKEVKSLIKRLQQEKNLLESLNIAHSLDGMAREASLFMPIATKIRGLPPSVTLDSLFPWHTSALQATAIETSTLPSRLSSIRGAGGTMYDLENKLNSSGKQNIVGLQFSVADDALNDLSSIDGNIGLFPENHTDHVNGVRPSQTFRSVAVRRGQRYDPEVMEEEEERDGREERRESHRYDSGLSFPLLDSFPQIYTFGSEKPHSLQVHTMLSASTFVGERIRYIEKVVRKVGNIEERETLSNRLMEISDEYTEGWEEELEEDD